MTTSYKNIQIKWGVRIDYILSSILGMFKFKLHIYIYTTYIYIYIYLYINTDRKFCLWKWKTSSGWIHLPSFWIVELQALFSPAYSLKRRIHGQTFVFNGILFWPLFLLNIFSSVLVLWHLLVQYMYLFSP